MDRSATQLEPVELAPAAGPRKSAARPHAATHTPVPPVFVPQFALELEREWRTLVATGAHVLLSGPRALMEYAIEACRRDLRRPVACVDAASLTRIPRCRTLILKDVDRLTPKAQRQLAARIHADPRQMPQIVSTTTGWLYALAIEGRFDRELFYRLNTIHLNFFDEEWRSRQSQALH